MTRTDPLADCRAVLLDMDGTLVDSTAAVDRNWASWARTNGVDAAAVVAFCHGQNPADTIRRFRPDLGDDEVAQHVARQLAAEASDLDGIVAMAGAADLTGWLTAEQIPWGVVTNADERLARARLGLAGLPVPLLVALDHVAQGKPSPEGYRLAARTLGVPPRDAAAVEDSATGLAAARAAQTVTIAVGGATDADVVCADLCGVLERLIAAEVGVRARRHAR